MIRIVYSDVLNSVFKRDFTKDDLKRLKEECKEFEEWVNKNNEKILDEIEKVTNLKFKERNIDVYICEFFPFKGISIPIIIRKMDKNEMIKTLIHELLHVILVQNLIKFESKEKLHEYINEKVEEILKIFNI